MVYLVNLTVLRCTQTISKASSESLLQSWVTKGRQLSWTWLPPIGSNPDGAKEKEGWVLPTVDTLSLLLGHSEDSNLSRIFLLKQQCAYSQTSTDLTKWTKGSEIISQDKNLSSFYCIFQANGVINLLIKKNKTTIYNTYILLNDLIKHPTIEIWFLLKITGI